MPGDSNQKGVKTVQTMLAAKKPGANESSKEKPSKQNKRTHSDVADESLECHDSMTSIQSTLSEIKKALQVTVTKDDLSSAISGLVQQKDLKDIVTNIVKQLLLTFEKNLSEKVEAKVRETTGKLQDQMDSLMIDNENLRERVRAKDKTIERLEEQVNDNNNRAIEAIKLGNYNEQYSRKHNIRMLNYPERPNEVLRDEFVNMVKKELKVDIKPDDVQAIHRIPGKEGHIKPVIVKVLILT
ncbi:unnamed protein product [Mytilus coruscus]|uniref:Uncharacterized protein n=1 Tax=Mytilus coruscus TaxID=42192 RepID=A0A6J8BAP9_MYTCO|nr:unnamed protein product [Mytilus coruscus]